jgi:hypothetical protein
MLFYAVFKLLFLLIASPERMRAHHVRLSCPGSAKTRSTSSELA